MIYVLAFLAAAGAFLLVGALRPAPPRVRLTDRDERPLTQRALGALFAPAAERVVGLGRGDLAEHKADLAQRLARAGHPAPFDSPEAVLGYRVLAAVLLCAMGGVFCLVTGATPLAALGLGAFGWFLPGRIIAGAEKERRQQLTLDAASTLDRLAIYVAAGNALPSAVTSLAQRPGGAWVAQFRRIAAHYAVHGDFAGSLEEAMEENGRLPEIAQVCQRLGASYEMGGGGVAQSLRQMSEDARTEVELRITEQGHRNTIAMVIPAFFAIVAMILILIAPGALQMMLVF